MKAELFPATLFSDLNVIKDKFPMIAFHISAPTPLLAAIIRKLIVRWLRTGRSLKTDDRRSYRAVWKQFTAPKIMSSIMNGEGRNDDEKSRCWVYCRVLVKISGNRVYKLCWMNTRGRPTVSPGRDFQQISFWITLLYIPLRCTQHVRRRAVVINAACLGRWIRSELFGKVK